MKGSENELSQNFKKYQRLERKRGGKIYFSIKLRKKDILNEITLHFDSPFCDLRFLFLSFSLTGISSDNRESAVLFKNDFFPYNPHQIL